MPDNSFDVNRYAISLQLSLDTGEASSALDQLEDQLTKMEQQVSRAAQAALAEFKTTATDITTQVADLSDHYLDISKTILDTMPQLKKIEQFYQREKVFLEEKHDRLVEAGKQFDDFIDQYAKAQKALGTEVDGLAGLEDQVDRIIVKLKEKNALIVTEMDLVKSELGVLDKLKSAMGGLGDETRRATQGFNHMWQALRNVWATLKGIVDEETEKFHTANYRFMGDMRDIAREVSQVSVAYSITREAATEAYLAFGNVRYPRDELFKLAGEVGQLNRITGVSVRTFIDYGLKLRMAGANALQVSRHLNTMAEAMRQSGISAETTEEILKDTEFSALQMQARFGDPTAKAQLNEIRQALVGIGKELGQDEDSMKAVGKAMEQAAMDWTKTAALRQLTGVEIKKAGDVEVATMKAAEALHKKLAPYYGTKKFKEYAQAYAEAYGLGNEQIVTQLYNMQELNQQGKLSLDILRKYRSGTAAAADADRDRAEAFAKSTENAFYQIQQIGVQALNIWKQLQYYLEGPVWVFAGAIRWILWGLNKILSIVTSIAVVLDKIVGFFTLGYVTGFFRATIGFLMLFLFFGTQIGPMIWGWVAGLRGVGAATAWLGRRFTAVTDMFVRMVQGIGRVIGAITQAIGQALANLIRPLAGLEVPLLALSVSVLLVGAGMWLMAQAAAVLADKGWAAAAALGGLVLATGLLMGAMVALAAFAPAAVAASAGLIPLGVAFALVGAAALMMGYGIKLALDSLTGLVKAVSDSAAGMKTVVEVAAGVGKAIADMAYNIGFIGAARLLAIAPALYWVASGIKLMGEGLEKTVGSLKEFGADTEGFTQNIQKLAAALSQLGSGGIARAAPGLQALGTALQQALAPLDAAVEPLVKLSAAITTIADKSTQAATSLNELGAALQKFVTSAQAVIAIADRFALAVMEIISALELVDSGLAVNLVAVATALTIYQDPSVTGAAAQIVLIANSFRLLAAFATLELADSIYEIANAIDAVADSAERAGPGMGRVVLAFAAMSPENLTGMVKGFTTMNARLGVALRNTYRLGDQYRDIRRSVGGLRGEFTALAGSSTKFSAADAMMGKLSETMDKFLNKLRDKQAEAAGEGWFGSILKGFKAGWEKVGGWFSGLGTSISNWWNGINEAGKSAQKGLEQNITGFAKWTTGLDKHVNNLMAPVNKWWSGVQQNIQNFFSGKKAIDAVAQATKQATTATQQAAQQQTQATQVAQQQAKAVQQAAAQTVKLADVAKVATTVYRNMKDRLAAVQPVFQQIKDSVQRAVQAHKDHQQAAAQTAKLADAAKATTQAYQNMQDQLAAAQPAFQQIGDSVQQAAQAHRAAAQTAVAATEPMQKVQQVEQQMMKLQQQYYLHHGETIRRQLRMQYNRLADERMELLRQAQPPMTELQQAQFRIMQIQERAMRTHGSTARRLLGIQYRDAVKHYQQLATQSQQGTQNVQQMNRLSEQSATAASKAAAEAMKGSNHLTAMGDKFYIVIDAHKQANKALTEHGLASPLQKDAEAVKSTYGAMEQHAKKATANMIQHHDRVTSAINSKAIPAMQQAKDKLDQQVRAETIATVQVAQNREGARAMNYQQEQNRIMQLIHGHLEAGTKNSPVAAILALLEQHLPGMVKDDLGSSHELTSSMNNWGA